MKKLLVIIPTYNESENVAPIIEAVFNATKVLSEWTTDILIVDDMSPDGTADIVRGLQKSNTAGAIHLLLGKKSGLGKAYIRGFQFGLKHPYDTFVMMDADFSHDPKAIPRMLDIMEGGEDYVIGSRYTPGGAIPGDWPMLRVINSKAANWLAKLLTGIDPRVTDITGGFKVINRKSLEQIDLESIYATGYFFQVNLVHAFLEKGFSIAEVPIVFTDRKFGTSKMKFKDIAEFVYRAYRLNPQSQVRQLIRFCIVGASGTIVNLGILTLLVKGFHTQVLIADLFAIELSIISNFFFNHYYTFRHRHDADEQARLITKLAKFNVGSLSGAAMSFSIFAIFFKFLGWHYIPADIFAIGCSMAWNYWVSTKYIWKVVDADS